MDRRRSDGDLFPVFGILWLLCVANVVYTITTNQPFTVRPTLCLAMAVLLPLMLRRTIAERARERR